MKWKMLRIARIPRVGAALLLLAGIWLPLADSLLDFDPTPRQRAERRPAPLPEWEPGLMRGVANRIGTHRACRVVGFKPAPVAAPVHDSGDVVGVCLF